MFVLDDEVFPLGIEDEVTITPIGVHGRMAISIGWRHSVRRRWRRYLPLQGNVGASRIRSRRWTSNSRATTSLAGAEFRGRGWIAGAVEVQYTMVPDSLTGGLADIYDEHDLGGFDVRFKIVIGR